VLRILHVRGWSASTGPIEPAVLNGLAWDGARLTVHTVPSREQVVDVDRVEVELDVTDTVEQHYRVRKGRVGESERPWC
jgi:hypothetical protein